MTPNQRQQVLQRAQSMRKHLRVTHYPVYMEPALKAYGYKNLRFETSEHIPPEHAELAVSGQGPLPIVRVGAAERTFEQQRQYNFRLAQLLAQLDLQNAAKELDFSGTDMQEAVDLYAYTLLVADKARALCSILPTRMLQVLYCIPETNLILWLEEGA